jgi:hypothetical protein
VPHSKFSGFGKYVPESVKPLSNDGGGVSGDGVVVVAVVVND